MNASVASTGDQQLTIPELLRAQAATSPHAAASIVDGQGSITFGEWHDRSNRAARGLVASGVRRGDRVGLWFTEGSYIDFLVAYIAAQRAGAAAVPVSGSDGDIRVARVLDDCGASAVVCEESLKMSACGPWGFATIAELSTGQSASDVGSPVGGDLAEIIYTSGTTGVAKGVACTYADLLAGIAHNRRRVHGSPGTRVLHSFPLGSAASQRAVIGAIAFGRTVVYLPTFDPERFAGLIEIHRPADVLVVPTMAASLLESEALTRRETSSVKALWITGSAASPTLLARLDAVLPDAAVVNSYGLTETGALVWAVYDPARPDATGWPAEGTALRVVDENGAEVAPGDVGEVWLSRVGAPSRHYYEDAVASAAVFRGDWVATGDLGQLDPDGCLHLRGRKSDVIHRGGLKISPAEIEVALCEHPAVSGAAAFGIDDVVLGEAVGAAVTLRAEARPAELRRFVGQRLGESRIPARLLILDSLPRNRGAKLRRDELRRLVQDAPRQPHVAPANTTEVRLARRWEVILGKESVGRHDSFFQLGGRSLSVMRLVEAIYEDFGLRIGPIAVYENDSLEELAVAIDARRADP